MNILQWILAAIVLTVLLGPAGILITVGLMLLMDTISMYIETKAHLKTENIKQNNVLVSIEIVEHKGQNMFLVFDAINKKFVLQGLSFDEVREMLKSKFEGKSIFVRNNENTIEPIYISPSSGLIPK